MSESEGVREGSLTVRSRESSTDRGDGRAPADDELIVLTLVVRGLRLAQYHVLHVQPGVTTTDNLGMSHCPILYAETWLRILIFPQLASPDCYCLYKIPDLTNICGAFVDG